MLDHQIDECAQSALRDVVLRYTLEDLQQGLLVEATQGVGGGAAEEYRRSLDGTLPLLLGVYHTCKLLGQTLLQRSQVRRRIVLGYESIYRLAVEQREYLDITLGVLVADVEPELVELIGRGVARVEPDVAALGLAELGAVGLGYQGARYGESLVLAA